MEVTRLRALRGPNLWSHHTAIQAIVSCNAAEHAVDKIDGFEVRLRARFPEIGSFQPTGQDNSIAMVHVLELAALGLQAQAGCPVTFSCTTPTVDADVYQLVVEYSEEAVGRLAMERVWMPLQACASAVKYRLLSHSDTLTSPIMMGTSTSGPITAVNAAPESMP